MAEGAEQFIAERRGQDGRVLQDIQDHYESVIATGGEASRPITTCAVALLLEPLTSVPGNGEIHYKIVNGQLVPELNEVR